eukprot:TRINITY_DN38186_c0_g1_i1.p1 TRINITY_DN38186_c0_g1~~TRINITY_DN38186_c0_g1_i1.p1  ORF type:complete len:394 (+),score=64.66 TRINITY_DN38186_c0_g1_i1:65-1183(+)
MESDGRVEARRVHRRSKTVPPRTIFECCDESTASAGDEEDETEVLGRLLSVLETTGPPEKSLVRARTFDPFEDGSPQSTAFLSASPTGTSSSSYSPSSAASSVAVGLGAGSSGAAVQHFPVFAGIHPGMPLSAAFPTGGVFWAIPMGLTAPSGSTVLAQDGAGTMMAASTTTGASFMTPQLVQSSVLVPSVHSNLMAVASHAATLPDVTGHSEVADRGQQAFAEQPQMPQTVTQELAADGSLLAKWTVDARKLRANEKAAISPPFEISTVKFGTFRLILNPAPTRFRGGPTFKNSCGRGSVQLKCETDANSEFSFRIFIGDGRGRYELPRGPVRHNFAVCIVGGLPKHLQEWDFNKAVDLPTRTFVVCLEVM